MQITAYITLEDVPLEIIIEYEPPTPAYRYGHPDNWEPADPGYTDLTTITVRDSIIDITPLLSSTQVEQLTDQAIDEDIPNEY